MAARKAPAKPEKKASTKKASTKKASTKKASSAAKPSKAKATKATKPKLKKLEKGPKEASTKRQLATIRGVFSDLNLEFTEEYEGHSGTSYFTIDTGVGELEDIRVVHVPGVLTLYARFGVRPREQHRAELERFASRMNTGLHHGCVVLHGSPPQLSFRASVDYSSVKDLERGYVGRLVGDAISMIETLDLPLILIAQGKSADEAIAQVLELHEARLSPSAAPKTKRASSRE